MSEATITITFREIKDRGLWDEFCEVTGTNPWCMNEGLADGDTETTLTWDEAKQIGFIND